MELFLKDINETEKVASKFAECVCKKGAFVTLLGDIGVGKTTFTRFLLKKLGVKQNVTSPTFVLLNEYLSQENLPIYHFDLYRLENVGVKSILPEILEYSKGDKLTLIEWANFADCDLPKERLEIKIEYAKDEYCDNARIFKVEGYGEKMQNIAKNLKEKLGDL